LSDNSNDQLIFFQDVITQPPKDHSELVNCFRERLHLQSLKYTPVDEQKELVIEIDIFTISIKDYICVYKNTICLK
jgi:hypothetical protein